MTDPGAAKLEGVSYWRLVWRGYRRSKLGLVGIAMVGLLILVGLLAPEPADLPADLLRLDSLKL